ncbi:hypothetical protein [Coleofasciculus sp. FACHB-SPT9]|uniref:hypothetical protein n=1 Tax=Cyanophyceae TaxID=3028117 RepID=UPI00168598D0|nr:hypothetical protein [Coleofasciculus sp. FACHB-SPT9]MBD1892934.1 hypothetical protein [Coleofasciculus sp. FACHB-SPT9]
MTSEAGQKPITEQVRAIIEELSSEEKQFLSRVVKAERAKLHMRNPRHINDDIWSAITEVIK